MYKGFDLSGKVAILTCSTAGMGDAIARGLARCGAKVVLSSNEKRDTEDAVKRLSSEGCEVKGVPCDITDPADVARFGDVALDVFGRADILFCLAAALRRLDYPIAGARWTACSPPSAPTSP